MEFWSTAWWCAGGCNSPVMIRDLWGWWPEQSWKIFQPTLALQGLLDPAHLNQCSAGHRTERYTVEWLLSWVTFPTWHWINRILPAQAVHQSRLGSSSAASTTRFFNKYLHNCRDFVINFWTITCYRNDAESYDTKYFTRKYFWKWFQRFNMTTLRL